MGQRHLARVDTGTIRAVAAQFQDTADLLDDAVRRQLSRLTFDGASAGRAHVGHGDALRQALHRLETDLAAWSRAAAEIAVALRSSADRYADAEAGAAARIG